MSTWNGGGSGMESVILVSEDRARKRLARAGHKQSHDVQSLRGIRVKMMQEKRRLGKIQMRKLIKAVEERNVKNAEDSLPCDLVPPYVLDRNDPSATKALASSIKQGRNEKASRFNTTLPKVRGISEDEMFKVVTTGKKTHQKSWKRIVTKRTFVGEGFTRQNPKGERFIRPMGLRQKFAHVSHLTLGVTLKAPIFSVKKNPRDSVCTRLGVLTRGAVVEVNVSELGLTTTSGKAVWGRSDSNVLIILLV
ncbi:hypothetical protein COL922a_007255 [Colletotrichum nupharicola]|nr:hypothetical protein COL922a_007255 [Colletotrichum nupharicola]